MFVSTTLKEGNNKYRLAPIPTVSVSADSVTRGSPRPDKKLEN
jgi:hypothetical protein